MCNALHCNALHRGNPNGTSTSASGQFGIDVVRRDCASYVWSYLIVKCRLRRDVRRTSPATAAYERCAGSQQSRNVNPSHGSELVSRGSGDLETPRLEGIVQTDALPAEHASVVVCQMTSDIAEAPDFRVYIEPTEKNGLRTRSQVIADKPVTIRRERGGRRIGSLDETEAFG